MDYQNPFQGGTNPTFHQNDPPAPPGSPTPPGFVKAKKPFPVRILALCLVCALLGGLGGGLVAGLNGNSGSTIQVGERTPVELNTVSTDTRKQMTTAEVYANYIDACVGISVDVVTTNYLGFPVTAAAAGSGFVITEDGYIMTNYHVIEDASKITVTFVDGTAYTAKLVGGDADNDIAVIKIEAKGLKPVVIGDSAQMYVGETVLTIGNPLGELTFSLSDGVVSALERSITVSQGKQMQMIQTNCTINSGNSGGPLFNLYGEVIGIVTAKYSSSSSMTASGSASVEGLGFAIPISHVKSMISDLISKGYVTGKPFLGISVQDVDAAVKSYGLPSGAALIDVAPGLAAAKSGLQEGDIVTAIGETKIEGRDALVQEVGKYKAGETLSFTVFRNGQEQDISVTLGEQTTEGVTAYNEYADKKRAEEEKTQQQQQQQQQGGGFSFPIF